MKEIKIGKQTWATENLDVTNFRNGDLIDEAKTNEEWNSAGRNKKPVWCYYENDSANGDKFGKLYNWYAVTDSRGLAPLGWHVPSDGYWRYLFKYVGYEEADTSFKQRRGWNGNGYLTVTDSVTGYDFNSGLPSDPCGYRSEKGQFYGVGKHSDFDYASWWSSSERNTDTAFCWVIGCYFAFGLSSFRNKGNGLAVRCIKD